MTISSYKFFATTISRRAMAVALGAAFVVAPMAAHADGGTTSPFLSGPDSFTLKTFLDSDAPLTFMGVTLYGTLDIGLSDQNNGAHYNPDFPTTVAEILQKNSSKQTFNFMSNGMEQSSLGLKGTEELMPGLNLVFKLETGYNPSSMRISNAQRALIYNAGNSFHGGTTVQGDSSRAGQYFQGGAFAGLSSPTFGTLTFGRHKTPMGDLIGAYDPQNNAYAFSPIGWSGSTGGGGFTEDIRLDQSIKYNVKYGPFRAAALYQVPNNTNTSGGDDAEEGVLGVDYAGLSADVYYHHKGNALNIGSPPSALGSQLLSVNVADITSVGGMVKYDFKEYVPVKAMAGYTHDIIGDPHTPLTLSTLTQNSIGDYPYSSISNTAYNAHAEIYHVLWFGTQYAITPELSMNSGFYMYITDNYSGKTQAGCLASTGGNHCAGDEEFYSTALDYRFNKRVDVYGGVMYTRINGGMYYNNSYLHNNAVSTTAGLRFKF